jgi:hypothetical protein
MTLEEFALIGSTGETDSDMHYRIVSPAFGGAHYELFKQEHHSRMDISVAKEYLRRNFDVLSVKTIYETVKQNA